MPLNAVMVEIRVSDGHFMKGVGEHDTRKNTVTFSMQLIADLAVRLAAAPNLGVRAVAVIDGKKVPLRSVGPDWQVVPSAPQPEIVPAAEKDEEKKEGSLVGSIKWMW